jgi:hypothetical protein
MAASLVLCGCGSGTPANVVSRAAALINPVLTGTFYGNDNGVYYLQQVGNDVWWEGESVDPDPNPLGGLLGPYHVWNRGIDSTSIFHGTISGNTLGGEWVEVNRGASLGHGTITLVIGTTDGGAAQLTLGGGFFPANQWTQGDPTNDLYFQDMQGNTQLMTFYDRFVNAKKSLPASNNDQGDRLGDTHNPENLRPYRDQTVFYGELRTRARFDDAWPHVNYPAGAPRDYYNFACNANDGDLDFRIRVDTTRIPADFQPLGWGSVNATDEGEHGIDEQDIIPKLLNIGLFDNNAAAALQLPMPGTWSFVGAEGIMYGGDNVENCPDSARSVFPGWADHGGNSILVNGRPIDGNAQPGNIMLATDPTIAVSKGEMAVGGLVGYPLAPGTEVRVTGALILDCGHGIIPGTDDEEYFTPTDHVHTCDQGEGWDDDNAQNQEIHPFYSLDLIECPLGHYPPGVCASDTARANLTGAWGTEDGGTYYIRQIGNNIWWLGLTRNRDPIMPNSIPSIPNFTTFFKGTMVNQADGTALITGQAVTLPKSGGMTGGDITTATLTVQPNHKQMTLNSSSSATFPVVFNFDKLYEPPDKTAPQSTLTIGSPQFSSGGQTFVAAGTPLTLASSDSDDGVQNLWYRIYPANAGAPSYSSIFGGTAHLNLSGADGLYRIDSFATDNSGNDEAAHSTLAFLDGTPPNISISQPVANAYVHSATLTLAYAAADAASGLASVSATLDGAPAIGGQPLASGLSINLLTQLALGSHVFAISSSDQVANAASRSVIFTIIVTPLSIEDDVTQLAASGAITSSFSSLLSKLRSAASAFSNGKCKTASTDYSSFISSVQAQNGKGITPTAAQILINDANYLISHCP